MSVCVCACVRLCNSTGLAGALQLHPGLLPLGAPVILFLFLFLLCFVLFCLGGGWGWARRCRWVGWGGRGGHLIKKEARLVPVVVFRTW